MTELFSVTTAAEICAGVHVGEKPERAITGIQIDSRRCAEGSLFVPLPGSVTDGHRFIDKALAGGAVSLVAERYWEEEKRSLLAKAAGGADLVVVQDPLKALHALAREHRRRFPDTVFIGVTGSSGKTTTKELIADLLAAEKRTYRSAGNLNSDIGLPLALLAMRGAFDYAVFEVGVSYPGEMTMLAATLRPDIGVITGIGMAHMEFFGTRRKIAEEKKALFGGFDVHSAAFLYEDDDFIDFLQEEVPGQVVLYGTSCVDGFTGYENRGLEGMVLHRNDREVPVALRGEYNLRNIFCAVQVARYCGIGEASIDAALMRFKPLEGRGRVVPGRITVIEDCYNANPDSVTKALDAFSGIEWEGRKVVILGDMLELGADSAGEHARIGTVASKQSVDAVFLFGDEMKHAKKTLADSVWSFWTNSYEELEKTAAEMAAPGDLVLLKGSRGMALERLLGIFR